MKKKYDKDFLDAMQYNPNYWVGPLYVNTRDPRLYIHKFDKSSGFTLNLGNPIFLSIFGVAFLGLLVVGFVLK